MCVWCVCVCERFLSGVVSMRVLVGIKSRKREARTPVDDSPNEVSASSTKYRFLSGQGPADSVAHLSHSSANRFVGAPESAREREDAVVAGKIIGDRGRKGGVEEKTSRG